MNAACQPRRLKRSRLVRTLDFWFILAAVIVPFIFGAVLIWLWDGSLDWRWAEFWVWLSDGGESGSTTIRNVGLVLAGVEALIFALWRSIVSGRQADAAQSQADSTRAQIGIAQEQLDTAQLVLQNDRYQRGAEMLGHEKLVVRVGGIYALQQLSQEHPHEYSPQIMNLLCAFVRSAPWFDGPMNEQSLPSFRLNIQPDAQRAIVAIGEMRGFSVTSEGELYFGLNLSGSNLKNAQLDDLDLSSAPLSFAAHGSLHHPLQARRTNLGRADLEGASMLRTDLSDVDFSGGGSNPARGLTLSQLLSARWDAGRPPILHGVLDVETRLSLQEELDGARNSDR